MLQSSLQSSGLLAPGRSLVPYGSTYGSHLLHLLASGAMLTCGAGGAGWLQAELSTAAV